jgi:hypothetical protein
VNTYPSASSSRWLSMPSTMPVPFVSRLRLTPANAASVGLLHPYLHC